MRPKTALISAAINDAPKLKRSDAITRGAVTTSQKWPQPKPRLRMNTADERNQHQQRQIHHGVAQGQPEARQCTRLRSPRHVGDLSSTAASVAMDVLK